MGYSPAILFYDKETHSMDVRQQLTEAGFVLPDYGGKCTVSVPEEVARYFRVAYRDNALRIPWGVSRSRNRVLLVVVDGFGMSFLEYYAQKQPFLREVLEASDCELLTAVYPSTTPVAMPAFHMGCTPQQLGNLEFSQWNPFIGEIINPIVGCAPYRNDKPDSLYEEGLLEPEDVYNKITVYERLTDAGVGCASFMPAAYAHTCFTAQTCKGSQVRGYHHLGEAASLVASFLNDAYGPTYGMLYLPKVDTTAHNPGPFTPEHAGAVQEVAAMLEQLLQALTPEAAESTMILISADHGLIPVNPDKMIYLEGFPEVWDNLRITEQGLLYPTGAPTDAVLHLRPKAVDKVYDFLTELLAGVASVFHSQALFDAGLFGVGEPAELYGEVIGDLTILTHPGHDGVWWRSNRENFPLHGLHGGLAKEVMEVPLLTFFPDRLK